MSGVRPVPEKKRPPISERGRTMSISVEKVEDTIKQCLFTAKETEAVNLKEGELPPNAIVVKGVLGHFGFHRERLESHRDQVREWLDQLSPQFHEKGGGGWSFLNACEDKNGAHWTGLHQSVDALVCLGIGLGMIKFCMEDREMWAILPGGMPYFVILAEKDSVPS